MVGILTEKPSQAKNFAKALGGMSGTFNGERYVIATAHGHLYELDAPENQVPAADAAAYKSWNVSNLPWDETKFKWKRARQKGSSDTLSAIRTAFAGCDELVFGGDLDPSGEGFLISAEIFEELGLKPKRYSRMYFVDEGASSIQDAFKSRKPVPDVRAHDEYVMAWLRSRWDFLSMQWTRVASGEAGYGTVLRQGRLKSAMVLLVGDQLALLAGYKKIPFYQNRFRDENGVTYTNPEEPTFPRSEDVPKAYRASRVICDAKAMKHTAPPKFFDLAVLSAKLATKGYKPKAVLDTYQRMYEAQVVSYPRTEDKTITPEQFNMLLPKVDDIARVVGVDPSLLTHRTPRTGTHVKPQGAHGANRPGMNVPASLDEVDAQYGLLGREIYEILARNYLASLAEDFQYEQQRGHVADYPKFTGIANVPKAMGWKAVFLVEADDDDEMGKGLGTMAQPFVFEGFPPKPAAPTMTWLLGDGRKVIGQLEKRDIGTGATRTSTLAEITKDDKAGGPQRQLLTEKRGKLDLAPCGRMSYMLLPGTHIGSLDMTKRVQDQMKAAAAGTADPEACLHEIQRMVVEDIATMQANGEKMRAALGVTQKGTSQGGGAQYPKKEKAEGLYKGKKKVSFSIEWSGHRFTDAEVADLLAGKTIRFQATSARTGNQFEAKGKLAEQTFNGRKFWGFKADFGK